MRSITPSVRTTHWYRSRIHTETLKFSCATNLSLATLSLATRKSRKLIYDKNNKNTLFKLIPPLSVFGMCTVNSLENKLAVTSLHTSLSIFLPYKETFYHFFFIYKEIICIFAPENHIKTIQKWKHYFELAIPRKPQLSSRYQHTLTGFTPSAYPPLCTSVSPFFERHNIKTKEV